MILCLCYWAWDMLHFFLTFHLAESVLYVNKYWTNFPLLEAVAPQTEWCNWVQDTHILKRSIPGTSIFPVIVAENYRNYKQRKAVWSENYFVSWIYFLQ